VVISKDFWPYGFDLKVEMVSLIRGYDMRCYFTAVSIQTWLSGARWGAEQK